MKFTILMTKSTSPTRMHLRDILKNIAKKQDNFQMLYYSLQSPNSVENATLNYEGNFSVSLAMY